MGAESGSCFMKKHNAKFKDSLFRMIFGGKDDRSARWRLELYNALSGREHQNPKDLKITTIENVIYITMKNDVSFLVDSQMSLWEHQSTWNPNMPLRGFMYFAKLYQKYISSFQEKIFDETLIMIPSPRYIVFYNGNKKVEEISKLRLSDAFINFDQQGEFEWTATMMNINKDSNLPLQNNCKPLYDYVRFVDRVKTNLKNGLDKDKSLEEAVDWAIREEFLEGFFKEQKAEVLGMCLTEFDQEAYDNRRRKEGYEEGVRNHAIEATVNHLKMGILSPEQIAQAEGLPLEKVLELQKEITVLA